VVLANCADIIYFRFTLRRTTASVFGEFENEANFGSLIPKFIVDYWYILVIWVVLTALLVITYRKAKWLSNPTKGFANHLVYFINGALLMALLSGLMLGGLRGGFRHSTRPITLSNAGEFVNEPLETAIVLNTPFAIYRTIGIKPLKKIHFYDNDDDLASVFSPIHKPKSTGEFKPLNVVVIILESIGREYIGKYNPHLRDQGYEGYTPFLDSLIDQGLMFRYSFSNGRKSIDVLPSVLASIPMMVEPYVLTPYSSNRINSFATLLKPKGYHTSFFHGAPNGSMGLQAFTKMAGFDKYVGMIEYDNSSHFDGMWGVWDEEFLQFFAQQLNELPNPFFSSIFTVSSHHPFKVPERYEGVFPQGTLPIHQCVGYTDYALRRFFEKVSKMPWFENTLFVITADHPNEPYFPEYKTTIGVYSVPIVFYRPDGSLAGVSDRIMQQIDILPSVLGYLNYDEAYFAFGTNAFDSNSNPYAISYTNSTYQLVNNDYLLLFDGEKTIGTFDFKTDRLLKQNILNRVGTEAADNEKLIKAIIQQYNNRMIDDKLVLTDQDLEQPQN
jgi:phosphoglycerol transferase MdoB-like AlkP superfamily enzyme